MNKHGSMNRVFRLIFNEALGAWIPVAETARARGKRSRRGALLLAPLIAALSPSMPAAAAGPAVPSGSGSAATSPCGGARTHHPAHRRHRGGRLGHADQLKRARRCAVLNVDQTLRACRHRLEHVQSGKRGPGVLRAAQQRCCDSQRSTEREPKPDLRQDHRQRPGVLDKPEWRVVPARARRSMSGAWTATTNIIGNGWTSWPGKYHPHAQRRHRKRRQ